MNVLLPHARDARDHAVCAHQCDYGHAQAVKRCDHVRVYVHVCVRVNVYERAHESVLCLRECVHAHGHAYDSVSANILPLVNGTSNLS